MSLKREMLVDAGIEDKDTIERIMAAYGSAIKEARSEVQAENDSLKTQLEQRDQAIKDLQAKEGASEEAKKQLADLQAQFESYKTDSEANLAQVKKTNAVALALKDVGAHNSEDLMKFIDLDKIELAEDGKPKLEETINGLKESSPYLFVTQEEPQEPQPKFALGGNPSAGGDNNLSPEEQALFAGFNSI
jgi:phage minor structural protein GP20|nr:MAG TPA: minor structural protein [Caudoviricetes sp.]